MQLTHYSPRRGLRTFNRDFNLLDDFFAPFAGVFNETAPTSYLPSVDIYERDDKLYIEAELPGFDKEEIRVDVKGRLLTLGGERHIDEEVKDESRYRKERRFGSFERTFKLPFEATEEQINASYKNGLLTLVVEKPEEQKPKQITIN